ncbi:S8 family peptidase [Nitrospira lenta]|uniref:Putative serine protease n=1 Tax=Nitrospira lenta TaxID=1436998 RepID=A0A330L2J2_9BACT|nr:S8 family peptidase [Nitrospira lenta]SPP63960.1 putative serine protease [Nitrospira lenta]
MPAYPHLKIDREQPVNEKRPVGRVITRPPENIPAHARRLHASLERARESATQSLGGFDDRLLFKLQIGSFAPDQLERINGVEVISQEDGGYALAFANIEALETFEARLATLERGRQITRKEIFFALQAFENWTEEDRKGWALQHEGLPARDNFMLDVELWPIRTNTSRREMINHFNFWLGQEGIENLDSINVDSLVLYRVRASQEQALRLLHHRDVRTVDLPPRFQLEIEALQFDIQQVGNIPAPPANAPFIAVLDSGVASGHPMIRMAMADAQGFLPPDRSADDDQGHGTHVAGIALYGDVEECFESRSFEPQLRLLSGRILDAQAEGNPRLIENLVEEAVRYFHEQYRCRIFNLSYGDVNKPYTGGRVKWLAYTLDRLSRELDVLFVIPTGNFNDVPSDWLRSEYPEYLLRDDASLIDPAPALNALTVGSIARWDQTANSSRWPHDPRERPIAQRDQPSPFTRCGASAKGAIKPDLVSYGGNWALHLVTGHRVTQRLGELSTSRAFLTDGRLLSDASGTSYAAPHVAHLAARTLGELPANSSINLVRAVLVANAKIPPASAVLFDKDEERLSRTVGYGMVNPSSLYRSTEEELILIAEEALADKRHHFYELPIPDGFLNGTPRSRRRQLTVALAYCPPVKTTRVDYKAVRMDFRVVKAESLAAVVKMFNRATSRDEYERMSEWGSNKWAYGASIRSKGTVQSATWTLRKRLSGQLFVVVTRNDYGWVGDNSIDERYALAIRMSDRENQEARLYTQINTMLQVRQRERVRVRTRT